LKSRITKDEELNVDDSLEQETNPFAPKSELQRTFFNEKNEKSELQHTFFNEK